MVSKFVLYTAILLVWAGDAFAQTVDDVERHVKAAFIYQFTKLVKWPEKDGDFVIYVIEDEDFMKILKDVVADKNAGNRKIKTVSAKWAEVILNPGDIAVFPKKESSFHKPVIEKLKGKPCLVVGFSQGLAAAGASINFFISDDKIKFELNLKSLKEKSLTADPILVKLGKIAG